MLPILSGDSSTALYMKTPASFFHRLHLTFFGPKVRHTTERVILWLAVLGFLGHLLLIYLHRWDLLPFQLIEENLLNDPLKAIYTPFSFILIYEVYLLVYYLQRSFTTSVILQYMIIALIVIRRLFKDISELKLTEDWFSYEYDRLFTFDLIGFLFLFLGIFLFGFLARKRPKRDELPESLQRFIRFKQGISALLVPVLLYLSFSSLVSWGYELYAYNSGQIEQVSDINKVFYEDFFMLLIMVDVLILIISLFYLKNYTLLIRNSGFVVSTVLIRLSFSATGIINIALIVVGVYFGVAVLWIYNQIYFDRNRIDSDRQVPY